MNGWVIDKSAVRRMLKCVARESRHHWRELVEDEIRVSESALIEINAAALRVIRQKAESLPSVGKTIK